VLHRLALALLSGAALCLAFPAYDVWALAPVAVALLAVATRGAGFRRGALLGLVAGLVFFVVSLSWSGVYVGALPWIALSTLQAAFVALMAGICGRLQTGPGRGGTDRVRPLVVALAWVGQEALRDRAPYGGFPWVRLAFSQADSPFGRMAAFGGAPLVTFAVALSGGLLAALLVRLTRRPVVVRPALMALGLLVVVSLAGLLVPLPTDGAPARVMAVQGNVARPGLDFNAERRQVLDNHVDATLAAAASGGVGATSARAGAASSPDLVVWPENSADIDPLRNPDAAAQIAKAVDGIRAPLIVGALLEEPAPDVSNVSLLYLPGTRLAERYVKQHPVPFAEYIPDRSFFRIFSDKVDLVRQDFAAGDRPVLFDVPAASGGQIHAGPTICFEVAYDGLVRENVEMGANLLLVQTNNATFGYSNESVQQLAISRIRAMEHGRSVVHVSTVGVSALITPDGTAHQASSLFTRAVLSGELPLRTQRTPASIVGPWPEYLTCLILLTLVVSHLVLSRARRSGGRAASQTPARG
jgi:apolipoprotein N-acyltransferase